MWYAMISQAGDKEKPEARIHSTITSTTYDEQFPQPNVSSEVSTVCSSVGGLALCLISLVMHVLLRQSFTGCSCLFSSHVSALLTALNFSLFELAML